MRKRKTPKVQATLLQGLDLEQSESALKIAKLKKRMLKPVDNAKQKKLKQMAQLYNLLILKVLKKASL